MKDDVIQSAVNTLGNWRSRRDVNGKPPTEEDARREAASRWPDLTTDQVAQVARACIERRNAR